MLEDMVIDLHSHSTASDGTLKPRELVREAKRMGVDILAITDHDSVGGVDEALEEGRIWDIRVIPGIEISTYFKGKAVHMLAYFLDHNHLCLKDFFLKRREQRIQRIYKTCERLKNLGIKLEPQEICRAEVEGTLGRPHVARALVKKGYVASFDDAFEFLLGKGKPAYVPHQKISLEETLSLIKETKGVPVLAHPGLSDLDEAIPFLAKMGLVGLEVYHPDHSQEKIAKYLKLSHDYNLIITGGSDFHGEEAGKNAPLGGCRTAFKDFCLLERVAFSHQLSAVRKKD